MDKLNRYRHIIEQILCRYAELIKRQPISDRETNVVFDEERDHYMLVSTGWSDEERILSLTVYVRIRDGKFYIEEDWLERGIATDLVEAGVPNEDIVLAFQHPDMRPYTEFAAA